LGRSIGLLYKAANHADFGGAIVRGKSPQGTGDKPRWPSAKNEKYFSQTMTYARRPEALKRSSGPVLKYLRITKVEP